MGKNYFEKSLNSVNDIIAEIYPHGVCTIIFEYFKSDIIFDVPRKIKHCGFKPNNKNYTIDFKIPYTIDLGLFTPLLIMLRRHGRSKHSCVIKLKVSEVVISTIKDIENKCKSLLSYTGHGIYIKSINKRDCIYIKKNQGTYEYSSRNPYIPYITDWSGKEVIEIQQFELDPDGMLEIGKKTECFNLHINGIYIQNRIGKLLTTIKYS